VLINVGTWSDGLWEAIDTLSIFSASADFAFEMIRAMRHIFFDLVSESRVICGELGFDNIVDVLLRKL
jgi:hypothetical protein